MLLLSEYPLLLSYTFFDLVVAVASLFPISTTITNSWDPEPSTA